MYVHIKYYYMTAVIVFFKFRILYLIVLLADNLFLLTRQYLFQHKEVSESIVFLILQI